MSGRKRIELPEPPRHPCGHCGALAATVEVNLEVRPLVVDRDAGPHAALYWRPDFRIMQARIAMLLCQDCLARHVRVDAKIEARVEKKA